MTTTDTADNPVADLLATAVQVATDPTLTPRQRLIRIAIEAERLAMHIHDEPPLTSCRTCLELIEREPDSSAWRHVVWPSEQHTPYPLAHPGPTLQEATP